MSAASFAKQFDFSRAELLRKATVWLGVLAVLLGFPYVFGKIYERPAAEDIYLPQTAGMTQPLREGSLLSQTFTCPVDKIRGLYVFFDASEASSSVMYLVSLYDETGALVLQNDFKTADTSSPFNILLTPLAGVKGERFTLELSVARTTQDCAARFVTMSGTDFASNAVIDGEDAGAPIALQFNLERTQLDTYLVITLLAAAAALFLLLVCGKHPVWNTAVFLVTAGTFFAVLNPLGDAPDEYAHMLRAQTLAQGHVLCSSDTVFPADAALDDLMTRGTQMQNTYARFSDAALYEIPCGETTVDTAAGTAGNYFFAGYLATALGVRIGTSLHLSAMACLYLARILNAVYYAALCCTAVALAPGFRRVFSFLACFPICVFLASSFSPDGVTIGLGLILCALLLRLFQQQTPVRPWQTAVWLGVAAVMAMIRMPYLVLMPMILLLPAEGYARAGYKKLVCAQLAAALGVVALWTALSGLSGLRPVGGASVSGQLLWLIQNPAAGLNALLGTMAREIYLMYTGLFQLGWNTYDVAWMGLLLPPLLVWMMKTEQPLPRRFPVSAKVLAGYCVCVWAVTYLGMYLTATPVGAGLVLGVQGRYFIELLALAPLALACLARGKPCRHWSPFAWNVVLFAAVVGKMIVVHYL